MGELKPCPFCGGDDLEILEEYDFELKDTYNRVFCLCCCASTCGHLYKEIAIKRWNRRVDNPGAIDFDYAAEDA